MSEGLMMILYGVVSLMVAAGILFGFLLWVWYRYVIWIRRRWIDANPTTEPGKAPGYRGEG